MEKLTVVNNLTKSMEILRNTECGKKEKLILFNQISECLLSSSAANHVNYTKYCSSAISLLLFFCEDLDSVIRMSAEENLNKIIRSLEANRMSRIFLDLYYEIKKNGNERSLRICLNLFSYYCPRIKEKNVNWYALKLLPCLQTIAMRKEILLIETLCDFMKNFSKYLQICLNDNETFKLMEVFLSSIVNNCAVKRRCSAMNCLYLIENSRNKISMSRHALNKALEFLVNGQETNIVLGVLGLLRLLLPVMILENACDCGEIIEIYDVCLHLLNNMNHSVINASLDVINSIISRPNRTLKQLFTSDQLQHNEILKRKKLLKSRIFYQSENIGVVYGVSGNVLKRNQYSKMTVEKEITVDNTAESNKQTLSTLIQETTNNYNEDDRTLKLNIESESIDVQLNKQDNSNRSNETYSEDDTECYANIIVGTISTATTNSTKLKFENEPGGDNEGKPVMEISNVTITTNEPHEDGSLVERVEDKLRILGDIDNESFNSIDFDSKIEINECDNENITTTTTTDGNKSIDMRLQKPTDSIGSFFNNFRSVSTTETMTKLFRPSTKSTSTAVDSSSSTMMSTSKTRQFKQNSPLLMSSVTLDSSSSQPKILKFKMETSDTMYHSLPTITNLTVADTIASQDDTVSLDSVNSNKSLGSHVSSQSSTRDFLKNGQDFILAQSNDFRNERNIGTNFSIPEGQVKENIDNEEYIIENNEMEKNCTIEQCITQKNKLEQIPVSEDSFHNENTMKGNNDEIIKRDTIDIGTIYGQTIIEYTVRFISSKFLLTGKSHELISDTNVRVSIKSLSLNVIANCVILDPKVLRMAMKIDKAKLVVMHPTNDGFESLFERSHDNSTNEVENHFQVDGQIKEDDTEFSTEAKSQTDNDGLLDIKDDHFGECTTTMSFLLNLPLGKSVDETLTSQLKDSKSSKDNTESRDQNINKTKLSNQLEQILTKSEVIETKRNPNLYTQSLNLPTINRTEGIGEGRIGKQDESNERLNFCTRKQKQFIYDILLFYDHSDPILRGSVQIIIGNFIYGSLLFNSEPWNLSKLLAILIKGLRDEIHTVVIQAMTSFDKIFPLLMFNYHKLLNKQMIFNKLGSQTHDGDDDCKGAFDSIDEVFMEKQLNTKKYDENEDKNNFLDENVETVFYGKLISPKFLLDQFILCYDNKYWLTRNKFLEVVSNFDCSMIREYYDSDIASFYEETFLKHLIHFLGDNDVRVREHTATCLRNFIELNSRGNNFENNIHNTDLNLLREFFDYRIFLGLSQSLRDLLNEERFIISTKEKFLSKVCYLMANELMELNNRNLQLGIISAIKTLIDYFNPLDYTEVWNEFNFVEICLAYATENYAIATDLQCQNALMEIITKLLAANTLTGKVNDKLIDMLFVHTLKLLNIYYHLFLNLKPTLFIKPHKTDIFGNTKEKIIYNSIGYFGNDYFYIKFHSVLKSAYDIYKITINNESGLNLSALLTTCLRTLSTCLDIKLHSSSFPLHKLIEEILQYLTILINYEPINTICCVRQLLKYLFSRNYGNRKSDYEQFLKTYFAARKIFNTSQKLNYEFSKESENNKIFQEMFINAMGFPLRKVKGEEECVKHIKLFEPLVIYCLTLFMKSNATIQTPILELLSQLLELNVTYSILDSKHVIYEQVMKNLDLIEAGVARNATIIIWAVVRFLIALTKQNDKKLITIPKIISVINSLLANSGIKLCSVLALKALAFEVFFTQNIDTNPNHQACGNDASFSIKELSTQREVVNGMLEKFVSCLECQKTLAILQLWNKVWSENISHKHTGVFSLIIKGMECGHIKVDNFESFFVLDALFKSTDKDAFLVNDGLLSVFSLFVTKSVDNFSDLSQVTIMLENVLLRVKDIVLINHIKVFLEGSQLSSCFDELNFFSKILHEKLETCFSTLIKYPSDDYCHLVVKYFKSLLHIRNMTAFNTSFKLMLEKNWLCGKYQLTSPNMEYLQTEFLKFVCELNLDKMLLVSFSKEISIKQNRIIIIQKVCNKFNDPSMWTVEEIENLFSKELIEALVDDKSSFVTALCQIHENCESILRRFSSNVGIFRKTSLSNLVQLIREMKSISASVKVEFLSDLYDKVNSNKAIQILIEHSINEEVMLSEEKVHNQQKYEPDPNNDKFNRNHQKNSIFTAFTGEEEIEKIISDYEALLKESIDENWLIRKITKLSSVLHREECAKILLDIKSEFKLKSIFSTISYDVQSILKTCIKISFESMISSFQNDCVVYNPHINYMNMNALLKVSLNELINQLRNITSQINNQLEGNSGTNITLMASTVTILLREVEKLEMISLMYVEYKFIQKFIREHIFKQEQLSTLLITFCFECSKRTKKLLNLNKFEDTFFEIYTCYECIDSILRQKFIWFKINQSEEYVPYLHIILDMLYNGITKVITNTILHKRCKEEVRRIYGNLYTKSDNDKLNNEENVEWMEKAIFIGKLIETRIGADGMDNFLEMRFEKISMRVLSSIAISLLRTNLYYVYAIYPLEVFYNYGNEKEFPNKLKPLSIPVEHLTDIDILKKFVKRLFIFGFSTRQQFEECFMSFLLLINKVYDQNMVDEEEQFQIKSTCLTAILELLITCKSFPVVGSRISKFHHSTRFSKIKCDNISLKKLHKVQLVIPGLNVFYQPNLERELSQHKQEKNQYIETYYHYAENNIIGTNLFLPNQYGLNHVWQLMEGLSNEPDIIEDATIKNIRCFVDTSGIDLKSSSQLIFDVLMQLIEENHILILPNFVKFCEMCENRDQIKWIKDKVMKLQENISIDDTISHQYIIYLLCKTQSILIPSSADLAHLCSIISTYLRSTHVFIRNATLHGLLCLLESCTKTSTSIGKLSEELSMVRDLVIEYISRHGIIEDSSIQFSDMHTKLVWTINFFLIEMTSKFVPDCNLLSNSIISANNLLKRTTNENIYLCILHGLERTILISSITGMIQPVCDKVEKIAVELAKIENEKLSLPAFKLLLSCIYSGSSKQLENTEHSNGIVQDDPEIIVQYTEKVDILLHRIKSSTSSAAKIYGQLLSQVIRDLVPPNEILTKVIKEFLALNQPYYEVIAGTVYQIFRSAIDSSFLHMLQDWLICSLPTFVSLPVKKGVWCLTVIFLSASINLHLIKLFPIVLNEFKKFSDQEVELFIISSRDFYTKLSTEQKERFKEAFRESQLKVYQTLSEIL